MNKLFLKLHHARSLSLGTAVLAVLAAGQLKADLVAWGSQSGDAVVTAPAYYFVFGHPTETCGPVIGQTPTMAGTYTCTSNTGIDALEGYPSALNLSSSTVPMTLFVGGAQGNVTGELTTSLEPPLGCTINGVPMTTGCANYFTTLSFQYVVAPGGSCASVGGCIPYEPFVVQTLGEVTYGPDTLFGGGTIDPTIVTFEYTPEPAFFLPLALGLVATGLALRKKALARHL